jgi:hypothetical protein
VSKRLLLTSVAAVLLAAAPTATSAAPGDGQWGPYPPIGGYYRRYAAPDASVRIEVKPKQAEVFVDGYYAGVVDDFDGTFQRLRLPPGEHSIEIYLDGYHSLREKVYLTPDNTFKIKRTMDKLGPGEQPDPRPQPPAQPPQAGPMPQPPPGYPPYGRVQGRRGQPPPPPSAPSDPRDQRDPRDARPPSSAMGTLAVRIQPADAELIVDGEPWRGPEGPDRLLVQLPDGRHTVEIRKAGYRTYITEVDVHGGETTPLNVSLRQQDQP